MSTRLTDESNTASSVVNIKTKPTFEKPIIRIHLIFTTLIFIFYVILGYLLINNYQRYKQVFTQPIQNSETVVGILKVQDPNITSEKILRINPLLTNIENEFLIEQSSAINNLVFSSLVKNINSDKLDLDLASEITTSDNKIYRIVIRNDRKWHDGVKVTADDVIFSFNQINQLNETNKYYGASQRRNVKVTKINPFEISVELSDSIFSYKHELTFPILPKHILGKLPQAQLSDISSTEFGKSPIGSGPYQVQEITNKEIILETTNLQDLSNKQANNHNQKSSVIIFRLFEDIKFLEQELLLGNVDLTILNENNLSKNNLVDANLQLKYITIKTQKLILYFNTQSTLENNRIPTSIGIRNALLKLFDRSKFSKELGLDVIYGPIEDFNEGFNERVKTIQNYSLEDFDKEMLALGYTKNANEIYEFKGQELIFEISYLQNSLNNKVIEVIKSLLQPAGLVVKTMPISEELENTVNNRTFNNLLLLVNESSFSDRYEQWHSSRITPPGRNLSYFDLSLADLYLEEIRFSKPDDLEKTKEGLILFQELFMTEVPAIYLLNPKVLIVTNINSSLSKDLDKKFINNRINSPDQIFYNLFV